MDLCRLGDWRNRGRHDGLENSDDCRAATHRVVAFARSPCGMPGGRVRILPVSWRTRRCAHDGARFRGRDWRPDVHGQLDGSGEAAGTASRAADYLQGPKHFQSHPAGGDPRMRRLPGRYSISEPVVLRDGGPRLPVWIAAGRSNRRSGHARCHCAAQSLRRTGRRLDGLHAVPAHVPRDESISDERVVWRIWQGSLGRRSRGIRRSQRQRAQYRPRRSVRAVRERAINHHRSRLWNGSGAGPACGR